MTRAARGRGLRISSAWGFMSRGWKGGGDSQHAHKQVLPDTDPGQGLVGSGALQTVVCDQLTRSNLPHRSLGAGSLGGGCKGPGEESMEQTEGQKEQKM